ncbi:MAG TPA: hypothetical protein VGB73_21010 [Pyrinomonadaceae bacterium]|jgi:hypothetical protein
MNYDHMTRVQGHNSYSLPPSRLIILSWNLQNFTGDHRLGMTHGSVDSNENMARAAVVAAVMQQIHADVLLVMETGSDVSGALEKVRSFLPDKDSWHPFVSGNTHAIPIISPRYHFKQKKRTLGKMRALINLVEFFDIMPTTTTRVLGTTQVKDALSLLSQWKNKDLTWLWNVIGAPDSHPDDTTPDTLLAKLLPPLKNDVGLVKADSPAFWAGVEEQLNCIEENLNTGEYLIEEASWIQDLKLSPDKRANDLGKLEQLTDALDFLELLCLMHSALVNGHVSSPGVYIMRRLSEVRKFNPNEFAPLAACLMASFSDLIFDLRGTVDGLYENKHVNFAYDALKKLKILDLIAETYGILFRPPHNFPQAMEQFFASVSPVDDAYGVAQKDTLGNWIGVQDPNSARNWRSALHIKFPISPNVFVPVCLFHTRFTGNESIKKQKVKLTQADKVLKMRAESVLDIALWNNKTQQNCQSLIIGDFNLPANLDGQVLKDFAAEMQKQNYKRVGTEGAYQLTTLKSVKNIIKDTTKLYNEPYDGVFIPNNFLSGKGKIQMSGARTVDTMDFKKLTQPYKNVLRDAVVRQYVKFIGKITFKMKECNEKLVYMCSRPGKQVNDPLVTPFLDPNNLVAPRNEIINVGNHFTLNLTDLDTNVVRPVLNHFSGYVTLLHQAAQVNGLAHNVKELLQSTEKEIDDLLQLMATLEVNAVARKTVAYRQIVSDHIPVALIVTYKY